MIRALAFCLFAVLCDQSFGASPYDRLIDVTASRNGVDRIVLRTIAQQESGKHPWVFNSDGESFRFASKKQAVNALWSLTKLSWMAKVCPPAGDGAVIRRFFSSKSSAQAFVNAYQGARSRAGKGFLRQRTDSEKSVDKGEVRIRQLWLLNTDIGIAQISYRFHGRSKASVQRWFDPAFNLNYAAAFLSRLKTKHGSDFEAAGYYHSTTQSLRNKYMVSFRKNYAKEKASAQTLSVATN